MNLKITLWGLVIFTLCNYALSAQPTYEWANAINGVGPNQVRSSVVDAEGNIYLTGQFGGTLDFDPSPDTAYISTGSGTKDAAFVVKYDSSGKYLWGFKLGGLFANSYDGGYSIALDAFQNVYISGVLDRVIDFDPGPGEAFDTAHAISCAFIAKYDPEGNYIWHKIFGDGGSAMGSFINVAASGTIYLTGEFYGSGDFDPSANIFTLSSTGALSDLFLVKCDTSGTFYWAKSMGGLGVEELKATLVDKEGYVYLVGSFEDTADFDPGPNISQLASAGYHDIFVCRYDSTGKLDWSFRVGASNFDICNDIGIDLYGDIVITGSFRETVDFNPGIGTATMTSVQQSADIFLARYNKKGEFLWAKRMGGSESDAGIALSVDPTGNIILIGEFEDEVDFDPGPGVVKLVSKLSGLYRPYDIFIGSYNILGQCLWANSIGGKGLDRAHCLVMDSLSNLYLTGTFGGEADLDPGPGIINFTDPNNGTSIFFTKYPACIIDTAVILTNALTLEVNSIAPNASYQWLDCKNNLSPIPGATGPSFTGVQNGSYAISITRNDCSGISNCHQLTLTGVPDASGNDLYIYPNPASDVLYLATNSPSDEGVEVTLYDFTGKVLFNKTTENKRLIEIPVPGVASGVCNMVIKVGQSTTFRKVLIVKQ